MIAGAQAVTRRSAAARCSFIRPGNRKVLCLPARVRATRRSCCVANLVALRAAGGARSARVQGHACRSSCSGARRFPPIGELPYLLTLPGHGFYWFRLSRTEPPPAGTEDRSSAKSSGARAVRRLAKPVPRTRGRMARVACSEGPRARGSDRAAGLHRRAALVRRQTRTSRQGNAQRLDGVEGARDERAARDV